LGLSRLSTIDAVLEDALRALVDYTGVAYGYVEVVSERSDPPATKWRAHAGSDDHIESIQTLISRGIIGRARVEGRTVVTPSAVDSARSVDVGSSRQHEIAAVVCSPFDGFWTSGVVYMQGTPVVGVTATNELSLVELAASQIGILADRFRRQLVPALPLHIELDGVKRQAIEEALRRNDWNISAVQRETGLSRKHIRRLVRHGRC
jgi:hypothetical protein